MPGLQFNNGVSTGGGQQGAMIPPPGSNCNNLLGLRAYEQGPRDLLSVVKELNEWGVKWLLPNFDEAEYLSSVTNTAGLVVHLTMSPTSPQVLTMYGINKFMGGNTHFQSLDGKYLCFLGNGSGNVRSALKVMKPNTVNSVAGREYVFACTETTLENTYGADGRDVSLGLI